MNMSANALTGLGEEEKELEKLQKKHFVEISDLKQKLAW
jgi:hypothetical protein